MVRVLRPGGGIGLFWNVYDDRVGWVAALCEVIEAEARYTLAVEVGTSPFDGAAYETSQPASRFVAHEQPMTRELLAAHLRSTSRFILLPEPEREALLSAALATAPANEFPLPHVCQAWRATKL